MHPDVPDTICVAVFDGHGGSTVSAYMYVINGVCHVRYLGDGLVVVNGC